MPSLLKKKWLWILALVMVYGGYRYYQSTYTPPVYQTATVEQGTITQTVSVSGTLVANTEIRLNFETGGRVKDILTVVGKQVSAGDVLGRLDVVELNAAVDRAQAALNQAEAAAGLSDESLRAARDASKRSKDYLNAVQDAQDQSVSAADSGYDNAKSYQEDAQKYYDQVVSDAGSGSAAAKSAKLTLTAAINARKSAEEAQTTARRNRDVSVAQADTTYQADKQHVETLDSKSQAQSTDSAVRAAQADYSLALHNLEKAQVKAPINGTVTAINYKKGEVIGTIGANSVDPFGTLLSLDYLLEAKVPESDIAKLKMNQSADVTFDAFPSTDKFRAEVIEIDPASTIIQDVVYYKVKFRLLDADTRLKAGMSGNIDIHIAGKDHVLFLPSRAIKKDGTNRSVQVASSNGMTLTTMPIETGLEGDESLVEVTKGLTEGQVVVVK